MLNVYDYQTIRDYFSGLATSHVDIASFKFGDKDVVTAGMKSNADLPMMWLSPYLPVEVQDNLSDNDLGAVKVTLYIYGQAVSSRKWEDRHSKYKEMEAIARDILSKIKLDWQSGIIFTSSGLSSASFGEAENFNIGASSLVGCRIDITFLVPLRLEYNASKWA